MQSKMDGMKTAKRGRFDSLRMLLVTVLIVGGLLAVKPIDSTIVRSIPLLKNLHLEQGIIPEVNAYYNKLYNVSDAVSSIRQVC